MPENLMPCPWCGSTNLIQWGIASSHWVRCDNCRGSVSGPAGNTREQAAAAWNKRAEPDLTQAINANIEQRREIERLRKENDRLEEQIVSVCISKSTILTSELEAENRRLSAALAKARVDAITNGMNDWVTAGENDRLKDAIRKARKMLKVKPAGFDGDSCDYIAEARRILKSALKGEG
jgi:plasmid stability protein